MAYEQASRQAILPWYRAVGEPGPAQPPSRAPNEPPSWPSSDPRPTTRRRTPPSSPPLPAWPQTDLGTDLGTDAEAVDDGQVEAARQARQFMESLMRDGLMVAVRTDATVFRAFLRSFNLLDPPEAITTDPDVVSRVLAAYQTRDERPPEPPIGPERAELLAAVAVA